MKTRVIEMMSPDELVLGHRDAQQAQIWICRAARELRRTAALQVAERAAGTPAEARDQP